jgi:hypothetical protein
MPNQKLLNFLLAVALLLATLAIVTVLPFSSNNIRSDLGYSSLCPFAPWSTLTLLAGAGLAWLIRAYARTLKR